MDGATLRAGAVGGITRTRNPIALARAVMEKSPHVLLIGEGAECFARDRGLEQVEPGYFLHGTARAGTHRATEEGATPNSGAIL